MSIFGLEMAGNYSQRNVANTEVDGGVVDTSQVTDSTQPYETGIAHPKYNGGEWVIVELYPDKNAALAGHGHWVEIMKAKPKELVDVNESQISQIAESLGCDTRGKYQREESHCE